MHKSESCTNISGSGKFLVCCLFIILPAIFFPSLLFCQSVFELTKPVGKAMHQSGAIQPEDSSGSMIKMLTSEAETPMPGDIIFTQAGSTDPDRFEFITLKRLNLTSLKITDNAVKQDMTLSLTEGTIYFSDFMYPCLADVPGGTFIRFERGTGLDDADLSDRVLHFYHSGGVSLNVSGDQVTAYLGEPLSPIIIASVNFANSGWITGGPTTSSTSYCPGTISDISLGSSSNYRFTGSINSNANATREYIKNLSNWEGSGTNLPFALKDIGNAFLPVILTSFCAEILDKEDILLHWSTASEVNNYGWDIERKSHLADWSKIGFVSGKGNSNKPSQYSFTDSHAPAGTTIYYRLKQIDIGGLQSKYSNEISVMTPSVPNLQVAQNYPNPFNNSTVISYSLSEEAEVSLKIFDLLGNQIASLINRKQSPGSYNFKLDMSELNGNNSPGSGIYLFKLQAGSSSYVRKFIVLK